MKASKPFVISLSVHMFIVMALVVVTYQTTKKLFRPQPHEVKLVSARNNTNKAGEEKKSPEPETPKPDPPKPEPKPEIFTRKTKTRIIPQIRELDVPKSRDPIKPIEPSPQPASTSSKSSISTGGDSFWDDLVQEKIKSNWSQPGRAILGANPPAVEFDIVVTRNGKITSIKLVKSSKISALDDSGREAIRRSDRLPKLPDYIKGAQITVPIIFRITDEF